MKKLVALLCLVVLTSSAFALNAPTQEEYVAYINNLVSCIYISVQDAKQVIAQGDRFTGEEERNQYATYVREQLEREYQALFEESPRIATDVYYMFKIDSLSPDIHCDTLEISEKEKAELRKRGERLTTDYIEPLPIKPLETFPMESLIAGEHYMLNSATIYLKESKKPDVLPIKFEIKLPRGSAEKIPAIVDEYLAVYIAPEGLSYVHVSLFMEFLETKNMKLSDVRQLSSGEIKKLLKEFRDYLVQGEIVPPLHK